MHKVIELIETLKQFSSLRVTSSGLPVLNFKALLGESDSAFMDNERLLEDEKLDRFDGSIEGYEGLLCLLVIDFQCCSISNNLTLQEIEDRS